MTAPWLSVVMPVYNGEAHIEAALASLVREDVDAIECIVVDDGSTDRSIEIASTFADRLSLTVIAGPRRGNWVAATNEGLRRVSLDHVCFLHQDDVWLPGRVAHMRELVDLYPSASLWVQSARFLDSAGRDIGRWGLPLTGARGSVSSAEAVRRLLIQNFLCIAAPVFRTADASHDGGLDENLWYTADWDLWLRLASRGEVAYDTDAGVAFRVHAGSQTSTRTADADDMRDQLCRVLRRHIVEWREDGPGDAGQVERMAGISIDLNVAVAAASHGDRSLLRSALRSTMQLPPRALRELLRSSRLADRLSARMRVQARQTLRRRSSIDEPGPRSGSSDWSRWPGSSDDDGAMSSEFSTDERSYADRLVDLQTAWWKRLIPVQAPYRWNLRRLQPGFTLEVGCGLGRNLAHLDGNGVGVDHNEALVAAARARGLAAYTPTEFMESGFARPERFDALLASHLVEHLEPEEAFGLLRTYLPFVRPGGQVIVLTPQERGFAADPTHTWFAAFEEVRQLLVDLDLEVERSYSFPLPRRFGRVFVYNEFVSIATRR